jgi:Putative type VII ESX secretion system translocon, EccE
MAAIREPLRYRFGPLERRGVIAGLRANQVATLSAGALLAAMLVHGGSVTGVGLALAVVTSAAVTTFAPVGGRIVLDWTPVAVAFGARRSTGGHRFRSAAAGRGTTFRASQPPAADLPGALRGVELLAVPYDGVQEVGVLAERGRYTAVLSARGRSFALKDWTEQEQQLAAWAGVVAELGRDGSPVTRLQWTERTVPDDGREHMRYLTTARDPALDARSPVLRSYQALVDSAGPVTQAHRLHLAVQVDPGKARRAVRQAGGGAAGACAVLLREAGTLARRLRDAGIEVDGILAPRLLAQVLRLAVDPAALQRLAWTAVRDGTQGGVDPQRAWATAAEETWRTYRTDSAVHRTYWIEEWPRTEVGANFLAPLIVGTSVMRTVGVTMEPVNVLRATRSAEHARLADESDNELRTRMGFRTSAKRRRQQENVVLREEELADGHADVRFSGYVTVSAADDERLEEACGEVEHHASQAHLVLKSCNGEQATAFTYTLPLCRGLRP